MWNIVYLFLFQWESCYQMFFCHKHMQLLAEMEHKSILSSNQDKINIVRNCYNSFVCLF